MARQQNLSDLEELNVRIGEAESEGKREWLESILAPEISFRRANGVVVGRKEYSASVAKGDRRETEIEGITLYGARAIVACVVTTYGANGHKKRFHNLRMFIRVDDDWKLLGWANEPM